MGRGPARRTGRAVRAAWRAVLGLFLLAAVVCLVWTGWVYRQIEHYAHVDQAERADVICVLGAAEYNGKPSPVLWARLQHGLELYQHGIAPMMVTMGGSQPGDETSEGRVGQLFLMAHGVPERAIIAETVSRSTAEQAEMLSGIARRNGFRRAVVVSDPTHMFRIHEVCAAEGLEVLTSPRAHALAGGMAEWQQVGHEVVSYTLWRVGVRG